MAHTRDVFRRLAMLGLALCVLIAGGTGADVSRRADTLPQPGDVVMAIGTPRTLERLEELFTAASVSSPRPSPG